MISKKTRELNIKNIEKVEGYELARIDPRAWKPFHKLQLTQVGFVPKSTMNNLGLWYDRPASEFIFLTNEEIKKRIARHLETHLDWKNATKLKVFKVWLQLHPDGDIRDLNMADFDELSMSIDRLHLIIREMRSRCSNPNSQDWKWYGGKGIKICPEWNSKKNLTKSTQNFILWSLKNGYVYNPSVRKGEQLSIDRIDSNKDYSPENCRWIPHRENCARSGREHREMTHEMLAGKNRRFLKMFPYAITIKKYIDWAVVLDRHFEGDKVKFKKFLMDNDYSKIGIQTILRKIQLRKEKMK